MCEKTKDLVELLEYYEENLYNRIFKYESNKKIDIDIVFYIENLCHILGIQHIYGKDKNKEQYINGQEYKKITNFEIIHKERI